MEIKLKEMRQQTPRTKNGIAVTARISNDGLRLGKWEGGGGGGRGVGGGGGEKIKWHPALKFL